VKPFLAYRNDFYAHLPPSYDTFEAAFFDVYTRVSHGGDALDLWKDLDKTIRAWALKSDEAQHMHVLSVDLAKLYKLVNDEKNKPYYRVIWEKNRYAEGLKWQSEGVVGNTKSMGEIADWLDEHAKSTAAMNSSAKK
jgi:phytoene dehydrogenase-like protein